MSWVKLCTLQKVLVSYPPGPVNVTLRGNGVFADDQIKMRSLGRSLTQYDWCPYRCPYKWGNLDAQTDRYRRKVIWRLRLNAIYKPRRTWGYTSRGRGMGQVVPHSPQRATSLLTSWFQTFGLQNSEIINFCGLSHSVCDTLLWQPQQTNAISFLKNIFPVK